MKQTFIILALFFLGALTSFALQKKNDSEIYLKNSEKETTKNLRPSYLIEISFQEGNNILLVKEKLNFTKQIHKVGEMFFVNIPKGKIGDLYFRTNLFKINDKDVDPGFCKIKGLNYFDSTLVAVGNTNNDDVEIYIEYTIDLLNVNGADDFCIINFENWYATLLPYSEKEGNKYPLHKFIEPFTEFADYNVQLLLPQNFNVVAPGVAAVKNKGEKILYSFTAENIKLFNWFLLNGFKKIEEQISVKKDSVKLNIFLKEDKKEYAKRYIEITQNYLKTLYYFSPFPYQQLNIIDLPGSYSGNNKSYSGIIALKSELVAPIKTQKTEYPFAELLAEQYFGNIVGNNNHNAAWLSKGISAYLAERMVRKYYGDLFSYFTLADYYPVYGLNFMTFGGIPLIYTIADIEIPIGARFIGEYYKNFIYSDLSMPACVFPNYHAYWIVSTVKPQLVFLTLHNYMGGRFDKKLQQYFNKYKFSNSSVSDFLKVIIEDEPDKLKNFYIELLTKGKTYDYAIAYIKKAESNNYNIMLERKADGVAPVTVTVFTAKNKLQLNWDGKAKFKIITFKSIDKVLRAELDIDNKNLLDLNFTNNSYNVQEQYWGASSLAIRVFFWFQNALMFIGGAG